MKAKTPQAGRVPPACGPDGHALHGPPGERRREVVRHQSGRHRHFYYKHLNFDFQSDEATAIPRNPGAADPITVGRQAAKGHRTRGDPSGLLMDSLLDEYTRSWVGQFAAAFDKFREGLALGKKSRHDAKPTEYWTRYGQFTRRTPTGADTILRRHQFLPPRKCTNRSTANRSTRLALMEHWIAS